MKRQVTVKVTNKPGARVGLDIHQFAAPGVTTSYADGEGYARFELDTDQHAEITIYVDGSEKFKRGPIQAYYETSV